MSTHIMFLWRNKKIFTQYPLLLARQDCVPGELIYVVTQSLASASVGVHVCVRVRVRVSTMFKFSKVCIVFFNYLRYCFHIWPTPT